MRIDDTFQETLIVYRNEMFSSDPPIDEVWLGLGCKFRSASIVQRNFCRVFGKQAERHREGGRGRGQKGAVRVGDI